MRTTPNLPIDSSRPRPAMRAFFRLRRATGISCSICGGLSRCGCGLRSSAYSRIWPATPMPTSKTSIRTAVACIETSPITAARSRRSRFSDSTLGGRFFNDRVRRRLGLRGRANPFGIGRDLLALHHEGQGPQSRVGRNNRVVKHGGTRADGYTVADEDLADLHDAVLVEMRLQRAQIIQCRVIADSHAVEFSDVGHVHENAASDFRAQQAHEPRQKWRAAQMIEQNLAG